MKRGKSEGETNHERLWTPGNKLRVSEGKGVRGWVSLVMGSKEGMYCMEHWCYVQTMNHGTLHQELMMYGD